MSRLHAWILPSRGGARLEDAGSKNRLILDGKRLDEVDLKPGIIVQVGRVHVTVEEASSGEFDLAVRAKTPDPDTLRRTEETDDSAERQISDGPIAGMSLIRAIEKAGGVDGLLPDVFEILGLESLLVFEVEENGAYAISRTVGTLPDDETLVAIEGALAETTGHSPANICLPSGRAATVCRVTGWDPDRFLVGIRFSTEPMVAWECDLYEYTAMRLMGFPEGIRPVVPRPPKRGLSLAPGMIVGESRAFRSLIEQLEAVVDTRMDVLLIGETGTGKELLAKTLHESGPMVAGPFIAINCAAIPSELLEAELFGVKGRVATGVDPRVGLFLEADRGSIFLDEIGELAAPLQAKLLRVLQEREVLPLGGSVPRKINVRVIAASNRDLLGLADDGRFRRDLYYRMSGLLIRVPTLRERKEDIPALALGFLERSARDHQKSIVGISRKAMNLLLEHDWPGNVRELQNEVARAVLFSHDRGVLHSEQFETVAQAVAFHRTVAGAQTLQPATGAPRAAASAGRKWADKTLQEIVDEVEREAITGALEAARGNKSRASRALGITRNGLAMKMKRLGLE